MNFGKEGAANNAEYENCGIQCWIYFHCDARKFARKLRNKLNDINIESAIDEDFGRYFPTLSTISDHVIESIKILQKNNGIAIIVFTNDFFEDKENNIYPDADPTDEFNFLIRQLKLGNLKKLIPIWYKISTTDVNVPEHLKRHYNYVKNILGHVDKEENDIKKISNEIAHCFPKQKYVKMAKTGNGTNVRNTNESLSLSVACTTGKIRIRCNL